MKAKSIFGHLLMILCQSVAFSTEHEAFYSPKTAGIELPPPTVSASVVSQSPAACAGGLNFVTILGSGGTPPYTFKRRKLPNPTFSTGSQSGVSPKKTFSVSAGTWEFKVTDALGNSGLVQLVFVSPSPMVVSNVLYQAISCFDFNNAIVGVQVFGGNLPYSVAFSGQNQLNYNNNSYFYGVSSGVQKAVVVDNNGCVATNVPSITVANPPKMTVTAEVISNPICESKRGEVAFSTTNGRGYYTVYGFGYYSTVYGYPPSDYPAIATNVEVGSYTVRAQDEYGCTATTDFEIVASGSYKIENLVATDAACDAGGSIEFTTSGGSNKVGYAAIINAPYGYQISYGIETLSDRQYKMAGSDGNSLDTGTYFAYIVDSIGCAASSPQFHIGGTAKILAGISTNVQPTCAGKSDGSILVTPYRGKRPFECSLDSIHWQTDTVFNQVAAGDYNVYVRDAANCVGVFPHFLSEPARLNFSIYAPAQSCKAGELNLSVNGGTLNYTYQQVSTVDTSIKIGLPIPLQTYILYNLDTNLLYRYVVTDANGCVAVSNIDSIPNNQLIPNFTIDSIITSGINCSSVYGQLIIKGIHAPTDYYNYYFTGSYYGEPYQDSGVIYQYAQKGFQTFYLRDNSFSSCVLDTVIFIPVNEAISVQATPTLGSCGVLPAISYDFCGGKAPYKVELFNYNLSTGYYDNLIDSDSFSTQAHCPQSINLYDSSVVCENFSTGDCGISIAGERIFLNSNPQNYAPNIGSADYGFLIPANGTGFEFRFDDYYAQYNSTTKYGYKINNEPIVYLTAGTANKKVFIKNLSSGDCVQFHLETIQQGQQYYSSVVSFSELAFEIGDSMRLGGTFENLSNVGYHLLKITDANGCMNQRDLYVYNNSLNLLEDYHQNPTCTGEKNGNFQVYGTGGTYPYSYQVDNGATFYSNDYAYAYALGAGDYHVTVTDQTGCSFIKTVTLTEPPKLHANLLFDPIQCKGGTTELLYKATGGTPPYSYSDQSFPALAGHFDYYVQDYNGCSDITGIDIPDAPAIAMIVSKLNSGCGSVATGKIGVIGQGGAGGFSYQINGGAFTTNGNFSALAAGNYTVTAKDANGCTASKPVLITSNSISVAAQTTNLACAGGTNGQILLTGSGGSTPYLYKIGNGAFQNNPIFQNLTAGAFVVTAKDANGCTATMQASVLEPAPIFINPTVTNETLNGTKGSISVVATGGNPPYLYKIDGAAFQNSPIFNNLITGNYLISVKDANGCVKTNTVTVSLTTGGALTILLDQIQPVSCSSSANGAIFTTVSGGCASRTYRWFRGNTLVGSSEDLTNVPTGEYLLYCFDNCGNTAQIDHIIVPEASKLVNNLTPEDIASCLIRYKWDAKPGATSFQIFHKKCAETAWQTQNIGLINFYDLPNLAPATCYDFAVRPVAASCPGDSVLTYLVGTKSASVSPPVHVTHTINSKTSATIKWESANCSDPFAPDLVELRYRKTGVSAWTVVTLNSSAICHTLNGLVAGACYQYRLRNHFASGVSWSNFTSIRSFCLPLSFSAEVSDGVVFTENKLDLNVISIQFEVEDTPENAVENNSLSLDFDLFPNPTKDFVQLRFESVDIANSMIINVLNIHGQKVASQIIAKNTDLFDSKINVAHMPSGLYFLEIQNDGLRKTVKFVKID